MQICGLCKRKNIANASYFKIPKDIERRKIWNDVCRIEFTPNARLCMYHFMSSDIISAGSRFLLMPTAVPVIQTAQEITEKGCNLFCALGCPSGNNIYKFPNRLHDEERRKYWLNFFDMEDPNIDDIYACERHFSHKQRIEHGIRLDAVPDKHPECVSENTLFIRKQKMLPITSLAPAKSQEPEQDPLNIKEPIKNEEPQPAVETLQLQEQLELQIPLIQPIQFSKCTQTSTRVCGLVEVSDLADDYRLKCFYCCDVFPIEKWKKYLSHLTKYHEKEEAFRIDKYVSNDHDYTPAGFNANSPIESENTPFLQPPSFATVVIEPNALLPLLVKPPVPFETVNISSNYYPAEKENVENCDKLLMPAPVTKFNVSSTPFTKKLENKNNKYLNASTSTKIKSKSNSNITPLSRCLKRSNTIESLASITSEDAPKEEIEILPQPPPPSAAATTTTVESFEPKPTELVFEYAPKDIMNLLLDSMKNYPVLWEFDEQPFNEDYYEAVEEICKIINDKWSLKIDNLKMRRSINRILRFYCYLYPLENVENINEFTSYYDKLASFMPESIHDVAYARCSHCYKCFPNDYELKNHLLEEQNHNLGWPYKCVLCKECYTDSDDYEFHRGLQHYEEILRCKYCNRTFFQRNKYNYHVSVHQYEEGLLPSKHVCDICGKTYPTSSRLLGHKKYHGEKKHKCHLCSKSFYGNSLLVRHLKRHRNEFDLICEVCGKGFSYHNNLREHMKGHTGAKVTCNICNLRLRKSSLNRHLRTVHVACEGTVESTYRARTHHHRQILKPKPTQPSQPRNRRTKSLNKKKYHCKICDIHFDGHKSIVEHNKEFHSDGTRYQCKLCTSDFGKKVNLRVHYRRKHHLHVYQVYKLVNHDDDVEAVLSIKQEELDRLAETIGYSLYPPTKPTTTTTPIDDGNKSPIIKEDCTTDEISFGEDRMHSDTIQDEIMKATDNIVVAGNIKIDDDQYMNDLLKML